MSGLEGKVAVVMGASGEKNFGSESARALAQAGCKVVVAARRLEPLQALADEIGGVAVACDSTDEDQLTNLFRQAKDSYGQVDIAVYSCGTHAHTPIAELSREEITPTLEISFIGALLFFKHAAAAMPEGGSVITVSSLTARLPGKGYSVYAGARAGIDYAIKVAACEYAPQKVRFNSIAAGLIETDMTAGLFQMPGLVDAFVSQIPAGRMGTVEDFAQAVLWLADPQRSGFINGSVIDLSGGQHMGALPG
jgi:NAD(P)-dependent dehydrogenase (short-subunit alcohol dehydrogenase family)